MLAVNIFRCLTRSFATNTVQHGCKVAVLGAAGGVGQPLSLLLKMHPLVSRLALYDVTHTLGVAADLSHCSTPTVVTGHLGTQELRETLTNASLVVIPAGVHKTPGMTRDNLFNENATMVRDLADACAQYCPDAIICVMTNPVNSTVPIVSEVLKLHGVYDENRVFGVTALDVIRANTFIAREKGLCIENVNCPVVGGHSGITTVPLLSQCTPPVFFSTETRNSLTSRIQRAGTEILEAKSGAGSETLSMAHAGARFVGSMLHALAGDSGIIECAYVRSDDTEARYFALPVLLGTNGIEKSLGIGKLIDFEVNLIKNALPELLTNIKKGEQFVLNNPLS